MVDKSF